MFIALVGSNIDIFLTEICPTEKYSSRNIVSSNKKAGSIIPPK